MYSLGNSWFVVAYFINILCIAQYNCIYKKRHIIRIVSNKTTSFFTERKSNISIFKGLDLKIQIVGTENSDTKKNQK